METPFNDIEKKLEKLNPQKLSDSEKGVLWSKIMTDIDNKAHAKKTSILSIFSSKFVLASLLIVALIGGGSTTVLASNSAGPGDVLFPIDLAIEKMQLAFARGNGKSTLRIKFSEERFSEATLALASNYNNDDSDDDTASTTLETATSSELASNNFNSKRLAHSEKALGSALSYIERTRALLVEEGDDVGIAIIDSIIADLADLTENHLSKLDKFEAKIKSDGKKFGLEIAASSKALKTKFKFEEKFNNGKKVGYERKFSYELSYKKDRDEDDDEDGDDEDDKKDKYKYKYGYGKDKATVCHKGKNTISVSFSALRAHLYNHGDSLGSCGGDDNDDDTTPDETAPVLSSIGSDVTGNTKSIITWTTNEVSDSKVRYATSTPFSSAFNLQTKSNANEVTSHSLELIELHPDTTYFYEVTSSDPTGNTATSSIYQFTTADPADTTAPTISAVASTTEVTTAIVTWTTDEASDSAIYYDTNSGVDTSDLSVQSTNDVTSHSLNISGLTASTTYYFLVSSEDASGNATTSNEYSFVTEPEPLDTTAPVISTVASTNLADNSATITWTTNEDADSMIYYSSTTDPVDVSDSNTELIHNTSMTQSHNENVTGLLEGTEYDYIVISTDASGNRATSTGHSFTTTAPDTTGPAIENITAIPTETTATVAWTTDEDATGKVFYGTEAGFATSTALFVESVLGTTHSVEIESLTAETTYYYVITSTDEVGNTGTSTESSFDTTETPAI